MVIYWSRIRKEVVFYGRELSTRNLGYIADKMLLEFAESGCPIFRATSPFSRGNLNSKGHGKLSIHFAADHGLLKLFRINLQNVVKNQESLTLKQMFDVTAQLVNNQEEINCLDKFL